MKRLSTIHHMQQQANRHRTPVAAAPALGSLPQLDWPCTPALQRAITGAVSEALSLRLSATEASGRVAQALGVFGVQLEPDALDAVVRSSALGTI
jgi:hypothetical protein